MWDLSSEESFTCLYRQGTRGEETLKSQVKLKYEPLLAIGTAWTRTLCEEPIASPSGEVLLFNTNQYQNGLSVLIYVCVPDCLPVLSFLFLSTTLLSAIPFSSLQPEVRNVSPPPHPPCHTALSVALPEL